jgi:hypothetical protein
MAALILDLMVDLVGRPRRLAEQNARTVIGAHTDGDDGNSGRGRRC